MREETGCYFLLNILAKDNVVSINIRSINYQNLKPGKEREITTYKYLFDGDEDNYDNWRMSGMLLHKLDTLIVHSIRNNTDLADNIQVLMFMQSSRLSKKHIDCLTKVKISKWPEGEI